MHFYMKRITSPEMLNHGLSTTNPAVNLSGNCIAFSPYCVMCRKWNVYSSLINALKCNQVTLLLFGCFNNRSIHAPWYESQMRWLDLGSCILTTQLLCIQNYVGCGGCFLRWVTNICFQELKTFVVALGHAVGRDAFLDHGIIVPLSQLVSQSDNCQTSHYFLSIHVILQSKCQNQISAGLCKQVYAQVEEFLQNVTLHCLLEGGSWIKSKLTKNCKGNFSRNIFLGSPVWKR